MDPNLACGHFFKRRVVSGTKLGPHKGLQSRMAPGLWGHMGPLPRPRSTQRVWEHAEVPPEPASVGAPMCDTLIPRSHVAKRSSRPPGWVGMPLVPLPSSWPQPADRRTQAWPPALPTTSSSAESSFIHLFAELRTF